MYVMSFVAAVPTDKKDAYLAHCKMAAEIFKSHGATRVVELWGDMVPEGEITSFPMAVAAKDGETVVTGWQEWPDKTTCDASMEKAMSENNKLRNACFIILQLFLNSIFNGNEIFQLN